MTPYYQDAAVTIYHADCREILPTLDPNDIALLLTDPPYGFNVRTTYASNGRGRLGSDPHAWRARDHAPVVGDHEPFDPTHLLRFKRCVLFGANHYSSRLPDSPSWLVWNRESGSDDAADAELAWTNLGGTVRMFSHLWTGYRRASEIGVHVHPTQKPVALMRWIIERSTVPGDLVLDPYMGSGPIERAAKDLGRKAIGIEIEERYCEIAARRMAQEVLAV